MYDTLIIGGGPAGLSAAIYLTRFNRKTLILDTASGRWHTHEINENYLGFPDGIPTQQLRGAGLKQAQRFGAEYTEDYIEKIEKTYDGFKATGRTTTYEARTLIIATGVADIFPKFPNWDDYVGKSLFWCITCDGYKTINKRVVVIGHDDEAATTCLQFLAFTKELTFVTNCMPGAEQISEKNKQYFNEHHIPYYEGMIESVIGHDGQFEKIVLADGTQLELDFLISHQGAAPNSDLARELGVELDDAGYIKVNTEQRTNVPFLYAAGDVTNLFGHQVAAAVHEGEAAACAANFDLYEPFQQGK